jgi:predicted MFS family arabinose efflux permease
MRLDPYRRVLALPGVGPLLLVGLLARVPLTAAGVTLTLHVVLDLHRGYGAAGLVGAASTLGSALGAPVLGRLVDRRGLRPVLLLSVVVEALFWLAAPALPYPALLVASGIAGVAAMPVFSVMRQSIAALVGAEQRRAAYALDSMGIEVSFMVGPTLAVLMVTQVSPRATMYAVGAAMVLSGAALWLLDPAIREDGQHGAAHRVPRSAWLRPRLVAVLLVSAGATMVLGATDVSLIAVLKQSGQIGWTGVVLAVWGGYSMVGGFVYGAARRSLSPLALMALLGACTLPVGLGGGWPWVMLTLVAAGALCAPTIAASSDALSRLVPAAARGEATGWQGSSSTIGMALGAPVAGAVIDLTGPAWGFVAGGGLGLLVAAVALPLWRRSAGSDNAGPTVDRAEPPATAAVR